LSAEFAKFRRWSAKALPLVCVLLVAISGFAQAIHVHTDDSKLPSHDCSVCSLAHAGVINIAIFNPVPVFTRAELFVAPDAVYQSLAFAFWLRIRPPPSA
jgi:hypothetical protein